MTLAPPSPTPTRPQQARGVWALRDRPGVLWLTLAVLVALVHPWVPSATWLMVHLVLLGALTHSAMVWSTHFTQALLKTPPSLDDRTRQSWRLMLLLVGTATVLVGVPTGVWPLTLTGAVLVSAAVTWHGVMLWRRLRRALPGRFRVTVRYYLAAAACLPVGAGFGAALALGLPGTWHGRLLVAHTMTMLLGWVGLTVTGTLVTLWPTMLRTRIDERAETLARQSLPLLGAGLGVVLAGALSGVRAVSVAGLLLYAGALLWWGRALWRPARTRPPREFATASVAAALGWLTVALAWTTWLVATRGDWTAVAGSFSPVAGVFAAGFGVQLLSGALSYLVPSVLGGGPAVVRAGQAWFDRWAATRLVVVNAGLALFLLPVPSLVLVTLSVVVLVALAVFVPLMLAGIRASVRARREVARDRTAMVAAGRADATPHRPSIWTGGQLVAGVTAVLVAVSVGVGMDPAAAGLGATGSPGTAATDTTAGGAGTATVVPTGETTRVEVAAVGMRFVPDTVTVPAGDRLVVELVNDDPTTTHDLVLGSERTPRLAHGERAELDLGVVTGALEGWCSVVGHRQMGMTFTVLVEGEGAAAGRSAGDGSDGAAPGESVGAHLGHGGPAAGSGEAGSGIPVTWDPAGPVLSPVDPALPPAPDATTHRVTLRVEEVPLEVAPGVWQQRWTFNGQVPGPTLRGRVGDVFEVTLVNDGTMGHSVDFHAGAVAPDEPMRTIAPGESLVYRFTAERSGIWMYHCSTMPMSAHIAAGMHGAVVIDPEEGLAPVDHEYVLVQSEVYLDGAAADPEQASEVSADAVLAERPDAVVFNGIANQYDTHPLTARVGERVRLWVLDAGPNRPTSFHVVGSQFDTVYSEGSYLLRDGRGPLDDEGATSGGSQTLGLQAAQGGFVELEPSEAGHYPLVSHLMVDAERGAHGVLHVTD